MTGKQEIVGPDLSQAEPIADVIARLAPLRNGYSADFLAACKASGISVTVLRDRDGVDGLQFGFPCDGQEKLREERGDALVAQMKRGKTRRQQIIDHLNLIGRFMDNQRFGSPAEWAASFLEHGGRLWVDPAGQPDVVVPIRSQTFEAEHWDGYPLRRLTQRHAATMLDPQARADLAEYIRQHGKLTAGGYIVLNAEGQADA